LLLLLGLLLLLLDAVGRVLCNNEDLCVRFVKQFWIVAVETFRWGLNNFTRKIANPFTLLLQRWALITCIQVSSVLPHVLKLRRIMDHLFKSRSFAGIVHLVSCLINLRLRRLAKLAHHIVSCLHHLLLVSASEHPRLLLAIIIHSHLVRRARLELTIGTNHLALNGVTHLLCLHSLIVLGLALHHGMVAGLRHNLLLPHLHQSLVCVCCSVLIAIHLMLHLLLVSCDVATVDAREQVTSLLKHVI